MDFLHACALMIVSFCLTVSGRYHGYKYHGMYEGKCKSDGFYYMDVNSYMVCHGGSSYKIPCGPGTQNSPFQKVEGAVYDYRDFCDINMVDQGLGPEIYAPKPYPPDQVVVAPEKPTEPKEGYKSDMAYMGKYEGKCGGDGLYYMDDESFMMCTYGQGYKMTCPQGTRNSEMKEYAPGAAFTTRNFCDLNMARKG